MYSPQEHTFTTGWEEVAPVSSTTTTINPQARAALAPRRTHRQPGAAMRMDSFSKKEGSRISCRASRRSWRISRTLFSTSRASTDRNNRVDTAFTSGVMRFLVME